MGNQPSREEMTFGLNTEEREKHLGSVSKKSYQELKKDLLRDGTWFKDPDFPSSSKSLSGRYRNDKAVQWLRPRVCSTNYFGMSDW